MSGWGGIVDLEADATFALPAVGLDLAGEMDGFVAEIEEGLAKGLIRDAKGNTAQARTVLVADPAIQVVFADPPDLIKLDGG